MSPALAPLRLTAILAIVAAVGCGAKSTPVAVEAPSYTPPKSFPALPKLVEPEKGISYAEVSMPAPGEGTERLWIYLPKRPNGAKERLPVVFVAPAGSPLWHGMELGDGDRPEHLPYVRAGFAVVAYSLDGPLTTEDGSADAAAARAFRAARSGVSNAQNAIAFALARLPIDPKRMYVAGHSSAGTVALQVAQNEPRLAGCIAYMPNVDPLAHWGSAIGELEELSPGYEAYAHGLSPIENAAKIRCPLFLYAADDDTRKSAPAIEAFGKKVAETNPKVTYGHANGGHYDAMIGPGVKAAVRWLRNGAKP